MTIVFNLPTNFKAMSSPPFPNSNFKLPVKINNYFAAKHRFYVRFVVAVILGCEC